MTDQHLTGMMTEQLHFAAGYSHILAVYSKMYSLMVAYIIVSYINIQVALLCKYLFFSTAFKTALEVFLNLGYLEIHRFPSWYPSFESTTHYP